MNAFCVYTIIKKFNFFKSVKKQIRLLEYEENNISSKFHV